MLHSIVATFYKRQRIFFFVRRLTLSSWIPFSLAVMCYFMCLLLGWVEPFQTAFWKLGFALGGRALSLALLKLGLTGGLAVTIGLLARVLITAASSEMDGLRMMPTGSDAGGQPAANPAAEEPSNVPSGASTLDWSDLRQFKNSEADPNINASGANHSPSHPASEGTHCPPLSSRASTPSSSFFRGLSDAAPAPELGEEVLQVSPTHSISQTDLWNELSPSAPTPAQDNQPPLGGEQARHPTAPQEVPLRDLQHQAIQNRLASLTPQREMDDDKIDALICLKEEIIDRMAQLDPNPFWAEQRNELISNGILIKGKEYAMGTLEKNVDKLKTEGQDSFFFKKLLKTREHFELYGRFA